jgi:hypothetical protein
MIRDRTTYDTLSQIAPVMVHEKGLRLVDAGRRAADRARHR